MARCLCAGLAGCAPCLRACLGLLRFAGNAPPAQVGARHACVLGARAGLQLQESCSWGRLLLGAAFWRESVLDAILQLSFMLVAVLATGTLLHVAALQAQAALACCVATDKAACACNKPGVTVADVRTSRYEAQL